MLYAQFLSLKGIEDPSTVGDLTINLRFVHHRTTTCTWARA